MPNKYLGPDKALIGISINIPITIVMAEFICLKRSILNVSHVLFSGKPEPEMNWYKKVGDGLSPIRNDDKHLIRILLSHSQVKPSNNFFTRKQNIIILFSKSNFKKAYQSF